MAYHILWNDASGRVREWGFTNKKCAWEFCKELSAEGLTCISDSVTIDHKTRTVYFSV